jgi:hypothetical protein
VLAVSTIREIRVFGEFLLLSSDYQLDNRNFHHGGGRRLEDNIKIVPEKKRVCNICFYKRWGIYCQCDRLSPYLLRC